MQLYSKCRTPRLNGAAVVQKAVWLGLLWPLVVVACHDQGAQPVPKLGFVVQPSNTPAGAVLSPPVQVAAQDVFGNTVTSFRGNVTIAIGTSPSGGTLLGTTTVAASNGIATFPDLSIDISSNGYTLLASAAGFGAATSAAFNAVCLSNQWTVKASMPTTREGFGVGAVNGMVYTVGGEINRPAVPTVEAYDPGTNTWTTKAPMPTARSGVGVGIVNGLLYAVGGVPAGLVNPFATGTVEAYDPLTNTWTSRQPIPDAQSGFAVGVVNGILYAVGAVRPGGSGPVVTGAVEAYDPVSNTWTAKTPMPTPRVGVMVGVVNGLLYAVGGQLSPSSAPLTVVEAYDPITDTWTSKASLPTARSGFGVGVVNGILYTVGGATGNGTEPTTSILNTVEAYDPATNTWTTKPPMCTGRGRSVGVGVLNGVLYALGGQARFPGDFTGVNEAYQP
jgi:N-acetylneuraminic acid mutarotase